MCRVVAVVACGTEERVLGKSKAPGSCPFCGGAVVATDVERAWRLLCLPICLKTQRNFSCSICSRRLVAAYT